MCIYIYRLPTWGSQETTPLSLAASCFSLQDPVRRSHAQRTVTAKAWQQAALVTKVPWLHGGDVTCHTHKEVLAILLGSLTKIRIKYSLFMAQIIHLVCFGNKVWCHLKRVGDFGVLLHEGTYSIDRVALRDLLNMFSFNLFSFFKRPFKLREKMRLFWYHHCYQCGSFLLGHLREDLRTLHLSSRLG